jgi:hypothetical protein
VIKKKKELSIEEAKLELYTENAIKAKQSIGSGLTQ